MFRESLIMVLHMVYVASFDSSEKLGVILHGCLKSLAADRLITVSSTGDYKSKCSWRVQL